MRRTFALTAILLASPLVALAQSAPAPEPKAEKPVRADAVFTPAVAITQGVVEGLTEYLPVSSTGHLILVNSWMDLEKEAPVLGKNGEPVMVPGKVSLKDKIVAKIKGEPAPSPKPDEPYTLKQATDDYAIVIQFGAIVAVLFAYWGRVSGTVAGVLRGRRDSLMLTRNLLVAFLPAAVLGLTLGKLIDSYLFNPYTVAAALAAGGVAMLWVQKRYRSAHATAATAGDIGPDLHELTVKQAATIGVCQCAALVPGTSRSMSTIVGGYLAGLSPVRATEFSFLLGLITLTAASAYKGLKHGPQLMASFPPATMLLGMAVAAVVAFASVKWMVTWVSRHGLGAFAWYRFALSAFVLAWFLIRAGD